LDVGWGALLILFVLLAMPLEEIVPPFGYLGEGLLVGALAVAVMVTVVSGKIDKDWFALFLFLGVAVSGSLLFGVQRPILAVVGQGVIYCKFFAYYLVLDRMLRFRVLSVSELQGLFTLLLAASVLGGVVNLWWGSGFYETFNIEKDYRASDLVPRLAGLQMHPNHFARTLLYCLFALVVTYPKAKPATWLLIGAIFILLYLTGSRTGLGAAVIILGVHVMLSAHLGRLPRVALTMAVIAAFALQFATVDTTWMVSTTAQNIQGLGSVDESSYIRGIMLYEGFWGSVRNFPFGWALATFGTSLSDGSPVYSEIGLASTSFVLEQRGIFDSNLGSVLGELGFLGIVFFGYVIWRTSMRRQYRSAPVPRSVALTSGLVLVLLFITSPVFVNDYSALIMAVTLVYVRHQSAINHSALMGRKH